MAEEIVDGYDHYPATMNDASIPGSILSEYIFTDQLNVGKIQVPGLNGIGKALKFTHNSGGVDMRKPITPCTQITLAITLMFTEYNIINESKLIAFQDSNLADQFFLRQTFNGFLELVGEGGAVMAVTAEAFLLNVMYRLNFRADIVAGTAQMKIAGDLTKGFDVTGVDLNDSALLNIETFRLANAAGVGVIFDDTYLLTNEYLDLPEVEVNTSGPSADDSVQWTPLNGIDNFAMVDEELMDGETTYNSSDTVGHKDMFVIPDLVRVPESIVCVSQITAARKEESATRQFKNVLNSGGFEFDGVNENLEQSYVYYKTHNRLNPDGSVAWNPSSYNAIKSGYELVS